jgi:hypothetical protein
MNAQIESVGKYNSDSTTFEIQDNLYHIDFFDDNYARISHYGRKRPMGLIDKSGKIIFPPYCHNMIDIGYLCIKIDMDSKFIGIEGEEKIMRLNNIHLTPTFSSKYIVHDEQGNIEKPFEPGVYCSDFILISSVGESIRWIIFDKIKKLTITFESYSLRNFHEIPLDSLRNGKI